VHVFDAAEVGAVLKWTRGVRQLPQAEAAASLGVSPELLRGLERGDRGVRLQTALEVLARMGYDVVLVPRDSSLALREATTPPRPETERHRR
jgi:transcriptional regulator with XRE-family HTH domain